MGRVRVRSSLPSSLVRLTWGKQCSSPPQERSWITSPIHCPYSGSQSGRSWPASQGGSGLWPFKGWRWRKGSSVIPRGLFFTYPWQGGVQGGWGVLNDSPSAFRTRSWPLLVRNCKTGHGLWLPWKHIPWFGEPCRGVPRTSHPPQISTSPWVSPLPLWGKNEPLWPRQQHNPDFPGPTTPNVSTYGVGNP